jgi:hypothetical protein
MHLKILSLFWVICALSNIPASAANFKSLKCLRSLKSVSLPYNTETSLKDLKKQLSVFRFCNGASIHNGVQFRECKPETPKVLTLRIKQFFFEKILLRQKKKEFRVLGKQNNALLKSAIGRGAQFLRLHFQNNDIQLLAIIDQIDVVPPEEAVERWDAEQGIKSGTKPSWRIKVRLPVLIWDNPVAEKFLRDLKRRP